MDIKLTLTSNEHKDLIAYCNLNDLLVSSVVKDSFTSGFNIEKYGLLNSGEKIVEKEVIKEVIKRVEIPVEVEKEVIRIEYVEVEKPVEVIKEVEKEVVKIEYVEVEKLVEVIKEVEVEKIVEVPVEVIREVIKEVFVTNIDNICDKPEPEIKEVIIEKIVEVIKEVEKIVEVPVEVIREVIIEKEVGGNLQPKLDALQNTVQKLKQDNIEKDKQIKEFEKTIQDLQKFQEDKKAVYLSGSNLDKKMFK